MGRNQQGTDRLLEPVAGSVHPGLHDSELQPYVVRNAGFSIRACSCSVCCYRKPTHQPLNEQVKCMCRFLG